MRKSRFTEEQIIGILKEAEAGATVTKLCRRHGITETTIYRWRKKYGDMDVSDARRLKQLEEENRRPSSRASTGTFRDECLNLHWFLSLEDAKQEIETWRVDYNQERPHSSLGRLTPAEYAGLHQQSEENLAVSSSDLP